MNEFGALHRVLRLRFSLDEDSSNLTWQQAKQQFQETLGQREGLVDSLLRVAKGEGVVLTGDLVKDCDTLCEWIAANATTRKMPNPLPEEWRIEEDPDEIDELDTVTLNACFALALHIGLEIERMTKGKFALKLRKMGRTMVNFQTPTIQIGKQEDFEPYGVVYVSVSKLLGNKGKSQLGQVVKMRLDRMNLD